MSLFKFKHVFLLSVAIVLLLNSCGDKPGGKKDKAPENTLFTLLPSEKTNINFQNTLTEGLNTNILMYEYFYNGGGVAVGDVNGDGFQDIYFSGNMISNRLYLNKGNKETSTMQFEDITNQAGVAGRNGPWKTGVTMADVNGDGLLDIYVCYSGKLSGKKRKNQLYINQGADVEGIPRFFEQAEQYGLADSAFSTQAVFFDYDLDDDLDMLLLNHNPKRLSNLDDVSITELLKKPAPMISVRLFRHDKALNGKPSFQDITEQSGLHNSALNYGLGAGISDMNNDGWPDIYICNDYMTPDYLYINNGNGTFTDQLKASLGHTSEFSMGNDIADMNNDGLPDIFTLDMLPEDNHRQKLLFSPDNYEKFDLNLRVGFHHQYMRNMLHINHGNGPDGHPAFSETGQLSGISNTDWSWAPLFADYDNDGWKDLFVTNGYLRDYTNMDFLKYMSGFLQNRGKVWRKDLLELVHEMPSSNVINYIYRNNGDLTFTDMSYQWGMHLPSNSNAAAYADLDNDGDLDLVVNNINQQAFIYENQADKQLSHHYLQVKLEGVDMNTAGFGAKVTIYSKGKQQYLEQMPARGYQSSVSPVLHFGLAEETAIDSLRIVWLSGKQQVMYHISADQVITLKQKDATETYATSEPVPAIAEEIKSPIAFQHQKNAVNDFKRQPLLVNPLSFSGPCLVKADVNGDGLEDVYAGGGSGQTGLLYMQQKNGQFLLKPQAAFEDNKESEDVDAVFFDANGDGFTDLYVCSGGYHHYAPDDTLLQDRLYLNDGKGGFTRNAEALPVMHTSTSCIRVADVNADGHADLFAGGRVIPGRYPEMPQSYLLINDGRGYFTDQITSIAPQLQKAGMVTDAAWADLNGDHQDDLIVVGEWMPVKVFINSNGRLADKTTDFFDKPYSGWWNKVAVNDFNQDGKPDLVVGNMGLNTQCQVNDKEPADLWYKDFDSNGSVDPILCFYIQGKSYPYVTRDELLDQMNMMRSRFTDYKSYADATLTDIFTEEELKDVNRLEANYLKTAYFESGADGKFHEKVLPIEVQSSPVFTITVLDYDQDGNKDLLLCGNINKARLRFGKYDANYGLLLKGDGKGNFSFIPQQISGFHLKGDVRSVIEVNDALLFGVNQQEIRGYRITDRY